MLALVAACSSTHLIESTVAYSVASVRVTEELAATSDIVTGVCHVRAEVEYLTHAIVKPSSFSEFYTQERHELPGSPDHLTATWKDLCDAYRIGDAKFAALVLALGNYAAALGAFAADKTDLGVGLGGLAKGTGTAIVDNVPATNAYASALTGAGEPLGRIGSTIQARWKATQIGLLVKKTDVDVQRVLTSLGSYVGAVRSVELRDARESLRDLVEARQVPSGIDASLGVEIRVSMAFIEVEVESKLQEADRRLTALSQLITDLGGAHTRLAAGWDAGESDGDATLAELAALTKKLDAEIRAFEHPVTGAGE